MNTYARGRRGYRTGTSRRNNLVKYAICSVEYFAIFLAVCLILRSYVSWFILSQIIGDNVETIFGACLAFTALTSIPYFSEIEDYCERSGGKAVIAFDLSAFSNAVIRVFFAGLVVGTFITTLVPHGSTFLFGKETVRTFDVEWKRAGGKSCAGYQVAGRPWFTHDRMCGLSSETRAKINKTGTIEIKGIENALGFRALKKIS